MSPSKTRSRLLPVGLAVLMAAPVFLAETPSARADVRVRVGGRMRVRVHPRARHYRARHLRYRTHRAPYRLRVRGSFVLGGGLYFGRAFAAPPPPAYPCDCSVCDCGPAIPAYYAPVATPAPPPPAPAVVVAPPPARFMGPRLGVGLFAGQMNVDGTAGEDVGVLARYRLTRALTVEGELAKTTLEEQDESRRLGGALLWDFSPDSTWSLHLLGALGRWDSERYAEAGAGLTFRLSQNLHLVADMRAGMRGHRCPEPPDCPEPGTAAGGDPTKESLVVGDSEDDELERFTRGRLSAILYF